MRNLLWVIIAIVLIGGGYWWYTSNNAMQPVAAVNQEAASPAPVVETPVATTTAPAPAATPTTVTVTYDGKSFSPSTITIKAGDTVMFKDSATKNMWVASDEHPTHTEYDGTSRSTHCAAGYAAEKPFDQCSPSTKDYSFTFKKVGVSNFHDHLNPGAHGSITVQ